MRGFREQVVKEEEVKQQVNLQEGKAALLDLSMTILGES